MNRWSLILGVALGLSAPALNAQPPGPVMPEAGVPDAASFDRGPYRDVGDETAATVGDADRRWTLGGAAGLLGGTPDDTGFGLLMHGDYFPEDFLADAEDQVSFGPLLQLGFTDDLAQLGLSGQMKYWVPVAGSEGRGRFIVQGGLGFIHADFRRDDTSWLIPLGVGYDYALPSGTALTATALLNFTNLETGGGSEADVMPGIFLGARF